MNKIRIKRNIKSISNNLKLLKINIQLYKEEKDEIKKTFFKNSISKFIEEIVEKAIKINSILLKEKSIFFETYYNSFIYLNKSYNLNFKKIDELADTTSFRNNLVHNYENNFIQISLESNMENFLQLYENYINLILSILKNEK